jgi:hypothetical protein
VGIVHTRLLPLGALHVPACAVALSKVADVLEESWPLTVMLVARSGPSLVMVKVIVIWLPALTAPEAGESMGATHRMHKSVAVCS